MCAMLLAVVKSLRVKRCHYSCRRNVTRIESIVSLYRLVLLFFTPMFWLCVHTHESARLSLGNRRKFSYHKHNSVVKVSFPPSLLAIVTLPLHRDIFHFAQQQQHYKASAQCESLRKSRRAFFFAFEHCMRSMVSEYKWKRYTQGAESVNESKRRTGCGRNSGAFSISDKYLIYPFAFFTLSLYVDFFSPWNCVYVARSLPSSAHTRAPSLVTWLDFNSCKHTYLSVERRVLRSLSVVVVDKW